MNASAESLHGAIVPVAPAGHPTARVADSLLPP